MREEIIKLLNKRMEMGEKKHGKWNPETDDRDLDWEMIEELSDFANYAIMQIEKLLKNREKRRKK